MMVQPSSLALSHPTSPSSAGGAGGDGFVAVEHTTVADPSWHFEIALLRGSSQIFAGTDAPKRGEAPQTLACFASPDGRAQFEVSGALLDDEVDPAEWLQGMLENAHRTIVSQKPVPTPAGRVGDVLAIWHTGDTEYAGRFFAAKWGAQLFIVGCSCPRLDYADFGDDFFACLTGFSPIRSAARAFAVDTHSTAQEHPMAWSAQLPSSWDFFNHAPGDDGAYFEAAHAMAPKPDEQSGDLDGKLAIALVARATAKRPRDASKLYLDALKHAGFAIEAVNFESEAPQDPFIQCWYMSSEVERDGARGQLHCRVAMNDRVWLIGGVVGPTREDDSTAWMRNKRALDIACSTVTVAPPAQGSGGRP
jgi:hypothetical protein